MAGLRDVIAYHAAHGFIAMASLMLDMCAATLCPAKQAVGSLVDLCPYYESDGIRVACRVVLARAIGDRATLDVLYAGSRRWAGVQSLIDCGIMRSSARFERFVSRGSSSGA